jgi:heme A synthase
VWARRIDFAPGVATAAAGLVILQALSGATVTLTRLGLFSTLLHAGLMAVLFASVAYLGELVLRRPTEHQYESRRPEATVGHVHPYFTP